MASWMPRVIASTLRKSKRPVASGAISPGFAWVIALVTGLIGAGLILFIEGKAHLWVAGLALAYLANTNLYSFYLECIVIADVIGLSLGFVLRAPRRLCGGPGSARRGC